MCALCQTLNRPSSIFCLTDRWRRLMLQVAENYTPQHTFVPFQQTVHMVGCLHVLWPLFGCVRLSPYLVVSSVLLSSSSSSLSLSWLPPLLAVGLQWSKMTKTHSGVCCSALRLYALGVVGAAMRLCVWTIWRDVKRLYFYFGVSEPFGDSWCLTTWTYRWFLVSHPITYRWFLVSHHMNL